LALPVEIGLAGRYQVGRILGKPGGFGVTYLGFDRLNEECVAIKEYVPREIAGRDTDGRTVVPYSTNEQEEFQYGLDRFTGEAEVLAQFDHANIVSVRDFFEANGTAYLVMEYYEGKTLQNYLEEQPGGRMDPEVGARVMLRVLDGLREIHAEGYLHRDVKPSNVYLTQNGRPILIDFGAARQAMGERSRSLSVVMTEGYAPYEQYHRKGDQGPHTDVYGCGATLYRVVTGEKPAPATERIVEDTLQTPNDVNQDVPAKLSRAVMDALAVQADDRPETAGRFHGRLQEVLRSDEQLHDGERQGSGSQPESDPGAHRQENGESEDGSGTVGDSAVGSAEQEHVESPHADGKEKTDGPESAPAKARGMVIVLSVLALALAGMAAVKYTGKLSGLISSESGSISGNMFRGQATRTGVYASQGVSEVPTKQWEEGVGSSIQTTPALSGGTLYFGTSGGRVYALSTDSGSQEWLHYTGQKFVSSPVVSSGIVSLGSMDGNLFALSQDTGDRRWVFETGGPIISSPVVADGVVLVGSGDQHLYAVDVESGDEKWSADLKGEVFSSPAVAGGTAYVGTERGYLYAIDVESGQVEWRSEAASGIAATPAVHKGTVYVCSRGGSLYAVGIDEGQQRWKTDIGAEGTSSPAVSEGRVFVTRDWRVYAFATSGMEEAEAGDELWISSAGDSVIGSPTVAGETIYVLAENRVSAVGRTSGRQRWSYSADETLAASPVPTSSSIYVATEEGSILRLK
jgi:outer membrane protein assembly factor BamB